MLHILCARMQAGERVRKSARSHAMHDVSRHTRCLSLCVSHYLCYVTLCHVIYLKGGKNVRQNPIFTNLKERIRAHMCSISAKLLDYFLRSNQGNFNQSVCVTAFMLRHVMYGICLCVCHCIQVVSRHVCYLCVCVSHHMYHVTTYM